MPLTLLCACGHRLHVPESSVGKKVSCPNCLGTVAVPDPRAVTRIPAHDPEEPVPEIADIETLNDEEEATKGERYAMRIESEVRERQGGQGELGYISLHRYPIICLAYGCDDTTALAADEETVFLLDLKTLQAWPLRRMHSRRIKSLSISADGRFGLSGDEEGGLLLWDLLKRKPLRWLDGHRDEVRTSAFSADGIWAASGGEGAPVRLWKLPEGERIPLEQGRLEHAVNCVCFSHDSRLLLAIGDEGRARLWAVDRQTASASWTRA